MALVMLTFDLLTLKLVWESKAGNFSSKVGHAKLLDSRIICFIHDGSTNKQTDGRTDGRTDKSNAYCRLPYPSLQRMGA